MEMHAPADLREIAVVAGYCVIRPVEPASAELMCMKQVRTHGFYRIVAAGMARQCYIRWRVCPSDVRFTKADISELEEGTC
jgi:hypothetical protein